MNNMRPPIDIVHLFPILNEKLVSFLKNLSPEDWNRQTVARQWKIKDVVAHLLDGNFRQLSLQRDKWTVEPDMAINSYDDLVVYLNKFNADFVKSAKRLSPRLLTELLEWSNAEVYKVFAGLDPFASSIYPVSWAGETMSYNWFDVAREYTERWLHQQQIRDAMDDKDILTEELYHPVLNIFIQAWPFTSANAKASEGTVLKTIITGNGGGEWFQVRTGDQWKLASEAGSIPTAETTIDGNVAWKLFSKSIRKEDIAGSYSIKGDVILGERILEMVSVMA